MDREEADELIRLQSELTQQLIHNTKLKGILYQAMEDRKACHEELEQARKVLWKQNEELAALRNQTQQ